MTDETNAARTRRTVLKNGLALTGVLTVAGPVSAAQRLVAVGPMPAASLGVPPAMEF